MNRWRKLAALRVGLAYGAGLAMLALVVATISASEAAALAPGELGRVSSSGETERISSASETGRLPSSGYARVPIAMAGIASARPATAKVNFLPFNLSPSNTSQLRGGAVNMTPTAGPAPHVSRRVFFFTPVPGPELPALVLPPPGARSVFIAAHADHAVLVSAPPR